MLRCLQHPETVYTLFYPLPPLLRPGTVSSPGAERSGMRGTSGLPLAAPPLLHAWLPELPGSQSPSDPSPAWPNLPRKDLGIGGDPEPKG